MISIVGAGPVGSYLAYLLAKKGHEVRLFEEHDTIGQPVQCTGLLTRSIENLIKIDKQYIVNKTEHIKLVSRQNSVMIDAEEYIVDREMFDKHLCNKATDAGAELHLSSRYVSNSKDCIVIKDKKQNRIVKLKTDMIIGADGPLSTVAKSNKMFDNRQFYTGMQARIRLNNNHDIYGVFLGEQFPGFFGWVVPEDDKIVRIGVAAKNNVQMIFNRFLKSRASRCKIISRQAGLIPIFNLRVNTQSDNVYLLGDAACQVKATTGGGIVPGMKAAGILADSIICNKNYSLRWKKSVGIELLMHLKLRHMLDRFSDKDYDELISMICQKKIQSILKQESRDAPKMLILRLLADEPKFLRYLKFMV